MDPTLETLARGLPRAALDALYEAVVRIPEVPAGRGRELARPGTIIAVGADSRGVRANVADTHQYVTRWSWSDDGAASLCSCSLGRDCEHAFALGLLLLAGARRAGRWNHARWNRIATAELAAERAGARETASPALQRHEHAVEALAHWAERGQAE